MSKADERSRAFDAASVDFEKALRLAENISDPWYCSQSLAAVARFAPEGDVIRVAERSLKAAKLAGDAYRRVAVTAWAVRALAERGKVQTAQKQLTLLMMEAEEIAHPVRKMDALALLWQAAWLLPAPVKTPVLNKLLAACQAAKSWKSGCIQRDVALVVSGEDRKRAQQIIAAMQEGRLKRQAQRCFDEGQVGMVRSFF